MRALLQADFLPGPTATQHTIEISRTKIKTEVKNTKSIKTIIQKSTVDFFRHHLVCRPHHKNCIRAAKELTFSSSISPPCSEIRRLGPVHLTLRTVPCSIPLGGVTTLASAIGLT
jgi:hypothetical protein